MAGPGWGRVEWAINKVDIWVWVKIKTPGHRRFQSLVPFTRVPFRVPVFDPQPYYNIYSAVVSPDCTRRPTMMEFFDPFLQYSEKSTGGTVNYQTLSGRLALQSWLSGATPFIPLNFLRLQLASEVAKTIPSLNQIQTANVSKLRVPATSLWGGLVPAQKTGKNMLQTC